MNQHSSYEQQIFSTRRKINARLAALIPTSQPYSMSLEKAMRYSLLGNGKRLRPLLLLATLEHMGVDIALGLDAACAIEMLHAASLVLDDLPCMDDDTLRRGEPSTHVQFSQELAILASVALINQAYEVVASAECLSLHKRLHIIRIMAQASGIHGLSAGQYADLSLQDAMSSIEARERINQLKTGALFVAAVTAGARIAEATAEQSQALEAYAHWFGLAFQQLDDLQDQEMNDAVSRGRLDHHLTAALAELGKDNATSSLSALTRLVFAKAA